MKVLITQFSPGSSFPLLLGSNVSSAPFFQTSSVYVLPLVQMTNLHTHRIELQRDLIKIYIYIYVYTSSNVILEL
jgi:hypothetical protein